MLVQLTSLVLYHKLPVFQAYFKKLEFSKTEHFFTFRRITQIFRKSLGKLESPPTNECHKVTCALSMCMARLSSVGLVCHGEIMDEVV